jgi:hypothetical protein
MAKRAAKGGGRRGSANCRAFFTTRNGRRVYAADYGYKCWPIGQ